VLIRLPNNSSVTVHATVELQPVHVFEAPLEPIAEFVSLPLQPHALLHAGHWLNS
jgi:hypothetical protein